jgi:hypothetical protein
MKRYLFCVFVLISIFPFCFAADWDEDIVLTWPIQGWLVNNDGRNGGVNVEKTVEAMNDLGVTGFTKHVKTKASYDGLVSYLEMFEGTGIKIWVVSGGNCYFSDGYEKYNTNCVALAKDLAQLSLDYPHLEGWIRDDYYPNEHPRHPNGTWIGKDPATNWDLPMAEKDKINPDFIMIPTLYYDSWDALKYFREGTTESDKWEDSFVDGTTMWYWASFTKGQTSFDKLKSFVDEANREISPRPFLTGFYQFQSGKLSDTMNIDDMFNDPDVIYESVKYAKENSDAVGLFDSVLFLYDLDYFKQSSIFQQESNLKAESYDYMISAPMSTMPSWFQEIRTSVDVSGTKNVRVVFDVEDSCHVSDGSDEYQFIQLIIADEVVWEEDVAGRGTSKISVDEALSVSGDVEVSIRLISKRGNHLKTKVYIDEPKVYVGGSLVSSDWEFNSDLSHLDEYLATYDAVKRALNDGEALVVVAEYEFEDVVSGVGDWKAGLIGMDDLIEIVNLWLDAQG